jgi:hypothetical protein
MVACGCSESRATGLLRMNNNDVDKAINHYETLKSFLARRKPCNSRSASSPPPHPRSHDAATPLSRHWETVIPGAYPFEPSSDQMPWNDVVGSPVSAVFSPANTPDLMTSGPLTHRPAISRDLGSSNALLQSNPTRLSLPISRIEIAPSVNETHDRNATATDCRGSGFDHHPGGPSVPVEQDKSPYDDIVMTDALPNDRDSIIELPEIRLPDTVVGESMQNDQADGFGTPRMKVPLRQIAPTSEWDFKMPRIALPVEIGKILTPSAPAEQDIRVGLGFCIDHLVAAVQSGARIVDIQRYLAHFPEDSITQQINSTVQGFPSIFFAVETNDSTMLRLWTGYGADVSAVHPPTGTPILAYAIAMTEKLEGRDTSTMVATLLSLGVSPHTIPEPFYQPYTRDLPEDGLPLSSLGKQTKREWKWCTPAVSQRLSRTANLTQRYYLDRATKVAKPGSRHRQIAVRRNAEAILGIQYFLVGQTLASKRLLRKLLSYITSPSRRPLILAFAGPSGHGKTELARQLGILLGLQLQVVDCTIVNQERELFGPRAPYIGCERGSPLNNFIAGNAGQRSVVFLDEFEKTSKEIHQSLLLPFDNGKWSP